jgi:hypothetical protein
MHLVCRNRSHFIPLQVERKWPTDAWFLHAETSAGAR